MAQLTVGAVVDDTAQLPGAAELVGLIGQAVGAAGQGEWVVEGGASAASRWIRVGRAGTVPPGQGWKLHVSATPASAPAVLAGALPVLLDEGACFKVAASPLVLRSLNDGEGGLSQIGKFLTVYPAQEDQAVRLAVALDEATRGLPGPAVPSDRALRAGSLVHYRYGTFGGQALETAPGQLVGALVGPGGERVPDHREARYHCPEWLVDPFVAAGIADAPTVRLVGGRFLVTGTLHRSPRGAVHLAMDVVDMRACVLKRACRDAGAAPDGRDARDFLRHEAAVLARLAPDPRFPAVYGLFEQDDGDVLLAMEEVEGVTLSEHIGRRAVTGRGLPPEQVVAWGRELAAALARVHAAGLVYRDLKTTNVIVGRDGRLRLVDFEFAHDPAEGGPPRGVGTRGYYERPRAGDAIGEAGDVYGLGAVLYAAATGAEPYLAPRPYDLLARPPALLRPTVGPGLVGVISRCLEADPAARWASMAAVDVALGELGEDARRPPPPLGAEPVPETETEAGARRRARLLAGRLGDWLHTTVRRAPGRLSWPHHDPAAPGTDPGDVAAGTDGVLLALAELVADLDDPRHAALLAEGAEALASVSAGRRRPPPGLYLGAGGTAAALLRAGRVLGDDHLVAAAAERARSIARQPHDSPDLFHGSAGRLRLHLVTWDATGDREQLRAAVSAGEWLLAGGPGGAKGAPRWSMPAGYGDLSGSTYLGYAHGAAGVADALLDLFEATADDRFLTAASDTAAWLHRLALPALDDGTGLTWPAVEGGAAAGALWCHGATGIGRFFLHATQLGVPGASDVALGAAWMAARGARSNGPTQCHGLAGNIELLLDVARVTGHEPWRREARSLARLLDAFAVEREEGLVWMADPPPTVVPGYLLGCAGVAVCLLRLADPEHRPHLLSREGFGYLPARRGAGGGPPERHMPDAVAMPAGVDRRPGPRWPA